MKAQRIIITVVCILIPAIIYIACQKSVSNSNTGPGTDPAIPATIIFSGRVTDNNQAPVGDATIKAGNGITTTDVNGYFHFTGVAVSNSDAAYVRVEKEGFFSGSRTFMATTGSTGYVAIQLIKKTPAGNFSAISGGSITIPDNGGSIQVPANSLISTTSNATYTGNVVVSAFFLNPASDHFPEMMPGTLQGINKANQRTGLQSFGMMVVELSGANSEKLQIAPGKTADLTFPIPVGLLGQAPATIPLWSFNDTTGLWKEEGTATRKGNNYTGTVSHFSFWNCDFPSPIVNFNGIIVNQNSTPLPNVKVLIQTVNDPISTFGYGFTDSAGIIKGALPVNKNLQLIIYDKCGMRIYTKNIGAFTSTANLGTIVLNIPAMTMVTFSGNVISCLGDAVTKGFVDVNIDSAHYYATVANGKFRLVVMRCTTSNTTAVVTAYDGVNNLQGMSQNIIVKDTSVATGQLVACGSVISEFFSADLNETAGSFTGPADSINMRFRNNLYELWYTRKYSPNPTNQINDAVSISFAATTTGATPLQNIYISGSNYQYSLKSAATVNITTFDAIGGYIAGNFKANLERDSSSVTYPVTASFRIKRAY